MAASATTRITRGCIRHDGTGPSGFVVRCWAAGWRSLTARPTDRSHTSDSVGSRCGQSAIGAVVKPRANGAGRHVNRDFASACEGRLADPPRRHWLRGSIHNPLHWRPRGSGRTFFVCRLGSLSLRRQAATRRPRVGRSVPHSPHSRCLVGWSAIRLFTRSAGPWVAT